MVRSVFGYFSRNFDKTRLLLRKCSKVPSVAPSKYCLLAITAEKLANFLKEPNYSSIELASRGWSVLWPYELTQRHKLYQYGLRRLMSFDESRLRSFFSNFFKLSTKEWVGFLTNTLPLPKLIFVMSKMFINSPLSVKLGMLKIR